MKIKSSTVLALILAAFTQNASADVYSRFIQDFFLTDEVICERARYQAVDQEQQSLASSSPKFAYLFKALEVLEALCIN